MGEILDRYCDCWRFSVPTKGERKGDKIPCADEGYADAKKKMCSAKINYGTAAMPPAHSQAPS